VKLCVALAFGVNAATRSMSSSIAHSVSSASGSPWTPDNARKEAKRLLGLVAAGKDPADEKAQAVLQARDTLRKIVDEYLRNAKARLRPITYCETARYLLVAWKPLHNVSVHAITRRRVAARVGAIEEASGATFAARARVWLSAMFN
jgi:hypothetical protein